MPPGEQVYRAQPFPFDPPPEDVPGPETAPRRHEGPGGSAHLPYDDEAGYERHDEADASHEDDSSHEGVGRDGTSRTDRQSRRSHGRRARRRRTKRMFLLAACLGTVLLGLAVGEIGSPGMPWTEPTTSGTDTQAAGNAGDATQTPGEGRSGAPSGSASADVSGGPEPVDSASASASPSQEPSPTGSGEPSPEPTEVSGTVAPDPEGSSPTGPPSETADPTPPDDHDDDPPDDDYDDCWLVFCS